MTRRNPLVVPMALVVLFAAASLLLMGDLSAQDGDNLGEVTYDRWCAGCHGVDGTGNGPGAEYMLPRPRDFTEARYQIRTTASGELPTDDDILAIIDRGMPGTTMPGWENILSNDEREALVEYLKSLSRFFTPDEVPEPFDFGSAPRVSAEVLAEGEALFQDLAGCARCHGVDGRGDGESSPTQIDDGDFPIRVADLTENWLFNGGGEVEDIYRRLLTGLDGTPMPSLADVITAGVMFVGRANELIFLFLGLELISIPTYVLLYLGRQGRGTAESTAKYFFLSILSSAVFLYGLSFVYGLAGTTTLLAMDSGTATIQSAICPISFSRSPLVVTAAVPIRRPDVTKGERDSPGTVFLFTVMPARSSAFSASLPVRSS